MSEKVDEGEAYRHTLNGLQRGVTYNISIVALSHHLPSLLVGPVTVYQSRGEMFPLYEPIIFWCCYRSPTDYRDPTSNICTSKHTILSGMYSGSRV